MTSLFVSKLRLSLFRSHKLADLAPGSRTVILTGLNGAGKTNILEALSMLSPGRGLRRSKASEMARQPQGIGWKVAATIEAGGDRTEVETWSENEGRKVRVNDKNTTQLALAEVCPVLWLVPSMDRLWIDGADARRRFLDRMVMSFLPEHGTLSLAYEKAMRQRNRLLKDQVQDPHWYEALEQQMAENGLVIAKNRRLIIDRINRAQQQAETGFPIASLSITEGEFLQNADNSDFLKGMLADQRHSDFRAGRSLIGPHRSDLEAIYEVKQMPARNCSTGEQKAMLISLVLANCRALAEAASKPPIVLLDEVAAHLDEERRAALYQELAALNIQSWMTGTGPELFTAYTEPALRIKVRETDGISQCEEI